MSRDVWDPDQYRAFSDERSRPFYELVAQVQAAAPKRVVDLGCGDGRLTSTLTRRWPDAQITGIDNSPEMIASAQNLAGPTAPEANGSGHHTAAPTGSLSFAVGDLADWKADEPIDVVISNAALQWVPNHRELLLEWMGALSPGGWLAFQVPGNFGFPSHRILRELCASQRWNDRVGDVLRPDPVGEPAEYLELLSAPDRQVSIWETTYLQVLQGEDPVLEWVKGTALRPVLTILNEEEQREFLPEYARLLREAYPPAQYGTVFPFRRIFVVAKEGSRPSQS